MKELLYVIGGLGIFVFLYFFLFPYLKTIRALIAVKLLVRKIKKEGGRTITDPRWDKLDKLASEAIKKEKL